MFNFTHNSLNQNIQKAITEINQKLDYTDPNQFEEIYGSQNNTITLNYSLNINNLDDPTNEDVELTEILEKTRNYRQIEKAITQIFKNLNLKLDPVDLEISIDTVITEYSTCFDTTEYSTCFDTTLTIFNPKKISHFNNYFENRLLNCLDDFSGSGPYSKPSPYEKQYRTLKEKPNLKNFIPFLLAFKDNQTKLPQDISLGSTEKWLTMKDLEL